MNDEKTAVFGDDDEVLAEAVAVARLAGMDAAEAVVRALRAYRQLHRFRATGRRVWVGEAQFFAEEWTWE